MKDFTIDISYFLDDKKCYYEDGCKDLELKITNPTADKLIVELIPHAKITLDTFHILMTNKLASTDKVYCNGYQAWTTSKEYAPTDKMHGLSRLTSLPLIRNIASISGDYRFCNYTRKAGDFHSHTYTYIKHPDNTIDLYGSLDEGKAFTIYSYSVSHDLFIISKDVEGLLLDKPMIIADLFHANGDYDEVFDNYFKTMGIAKPRIDGLKGYTSWYNYFQNINEDIILRDLEGMASANLGANIFQIDDGYQEYVGDFMRVNKQKFPHGMKYIADKIHEKNMLAGLWLAPFSAERKSAVAREHRDWLIVDKNGKPPIAVIAWSKAYTLDIYNPEARAYIKKTLSTVVNDWGFDMVKLDFLYSACMEPRLGKSRGMLMREAMEFLRECVGEKTLMLGCGVPLGPSFGIVDACRISCDVDIKFKMRPHYRIINSEIISAKNAMTNSIFRRHLSGRAFANDPDVFFLRKENLTYTLDEKRTLLTINNMFGDVLFVSDNVGGYDQGQLELLAQAFDKKPIKFIRCNYVDKGSIEVVYAIDGGNTQTRVFHIGK